MTELALILAAVLAAIAGYRGWKRLRRWYVAESRRMSRSEQRRLAKIEAGRKAQAKLHAMQDTH